MALQVELPPELEAKLRERAAAVGKDVADIVREVLEEKFIARKDANFRLPDPSIERRRAELRAWAASHRTLDYEADDSRESIYEGCGE
ncbi:MAG TPA: hypothetical protein PKG54_14545 [Phycisphaerae bacterium]|jgi:plasmid stability protein|nr:ribbon-helix-helix protein, CopG family [Phycisphaerae bacterium]HOB75734.1 hypothetical protein [Phycisphaerae bacterium]HPU34262.1 hypothetical protein [Phycisphaerae bacterium]